MFRSLLILNSKKFIKPISFPKHPIFLTHNFKKPNSIINSTNLKFSFYSTSAINTTAKKSPPLPRPLPELKNKTTQYIIFGLIGVGFWIGAIIASFNYQRLNSSTVQGSLFNLKYHPKSLELLGRNINFASSFSWIKGSINHLKGQVDFQYTVKGDKGKGTVHFHSIRDFHDHKWKIIEFTLTTEDGIIVPLNLDESLLNN
ncbi:cytochrome oxidase complex assembly protein 1-domain-containing protein [Glomus cerebriforme]|uniref:Cytochrome oxidase complex assembly protein 1-domain-containing protein n=1 Tax=Glomus cerebriforme TaxID=658196 RepID=A0A397TF38_9GLOM|nr:cytochrome oxidase complex assembly protein 1-domain-containing protein [Glomus cerebriforme]